MWGGTAGKHETHMKLGRKLHSLITQALKEPVGSDSQVHWCAFWEQFPDMIGQKAGFTVNGEQRSENKWAVWLKRRGGLEDSLRGKQGSRGTRENTQRKRDLECSWRCIKGRVLEGRVLDPGLGRGLALCGRNGSSAPRVWPSGRFVDAGVGHWADLLWVSSIFSLGR